MDVRLGLIGCGGIGELRAEAIQRVPGQKLVAVSDLDSHRVARFTAQFRCDGEMNWQSLLARRDIDAVIVSTPPALHAEMSIEALHQGKHVLCEKPLARTVEECRAMIDASRHANVHLATGFNYRFYPSILKARDLLHSGVIGELNHVRSYAGYSATDHNHEWLHDSNMMGGGALRDNGIHLIDLTRFFLGEVEVVKGIVSNTVWNYQGCEDNAFALLRSPSGVIGSLQVSWTEWRGYRFCIELYGTLGCIRVWCFPIMVQATWSTEVGGPTQRKSYYFPKTFIFEHLRSYRWVVVQSFIKELSAFSRMINGEKTILASGMDGLHSNMIAHAIAQDSFEGFQGP